MIFTLKGKEEVIEKVQKPHFGFNEFGHLYNLTLQPLMTIPLKLPDFSSMMLLYLQKGQD